MLKNLFKPRPLQQNDRKYRKIMYGSRTVSDRGCPLFACANAYLFLTGGKLDIRDLVNLSLSNDCLHETNGTEWKFLFVFTKQYGLDLKISHDIKKTINEIKNGAVAIVSAHNKNKQIFTKLGHWLVLVGVKNSGFLIYDSVISKPHRYNEPEQKLAIKQGKLRVHKFLKYVWADAKLLASEVKPEFPEPVKCENFASKPFGAAILRLKKV